MKKNSLADLVLSLDDTQELYDLFRVAGDKPKMNQVPGFSLVWFNSPSKGWVVDVATQYTDEGIVQFSKEGRLYPAYVKSDPVILKIIEASKQDEIKT